MAVLEKIRVKFGILISVLIAFALLSFIIDPNTLSNISNSMSSKYDVGKINGKKVRYEDFSKEVERITHIYETMNGGSLNQSEQVQKGIQDEAWQNYINDNLFFKAVAAAGISVGSAEQVALMSGNSASAVMAQNPNFADPQTGAFSQEALLAFIEYMRQDESGRIAEYWDYLSKSVYAEQMYTKFGSLFTASNLQNPVDVEAAIADNNTTSDVKFVMYPLIDEPDSTVKVSDAEVKAYYKNHKAQYKQAESRDIEYVVFEVKPSDKDVLAASEKINKVYDDFAACEVKDIKSFLGRNSDRKFDSYYYGKGELSSVNSDVEAFVASGAKGTSKVFQGAEAFFAARVIDVKQLPASVSVQYVALPGADAAKADSVARVIRGGKAVEAVAATFGQNGETIELSQNTIVSGMEKVLDTPKNGVCVCNLPNVSYVFKVLDRKNIEERKQVAILAKSISASNETNNSFYVQANAIAASAKGTLEGFRAAVKEAGVYAHPVSKMLESADRLGSVEQTREVTRWAFEQKKPGKVSKIFTINNRYYVVAAVTGVNKEGYVPESQAAISIRDILSYEKNAQVVADRLGKEVEGCANLDEVADKLKLTVSNVENVAFASFNNQGLDPKFIGALSAAEEGKLCGPVAGNYGVYFFTVTARETGSFYTEDDAARAASQVNQYILNTVISVMSEDKVIDNRVKFF